MTTFRSTKNKQQNEKEVTKGNLKVLRELMLAPRADLNMTSILTKIDLRMASVSGENVAIAHDCINLTAGRV